MEEDKDQLVPLTRERIIRNWPTAWNSQGLVRVGEDRYIFFSATQNGERYSDSYVAFLKNGVIVIHHGLPPDEVLFPDVMHIGQDFSLEELAQARDLVDSLGALGEVG